MRHDVADSPTNKAPLARRVLVMEGQEETTPSSHASAMKLNKPKWEAAERKELDNHERLGSFRMINRKDVPPGRKLVRLIWVYKIKRDGTYKARLCVQGCNLVHGIDYCHPDVPNVRAQ